MGEYYNTIILRLLKDLIRKNSSKITLKEIVFMDPILIQKN